ncbi:hypothetical protein GRAN_3310 [Granulicella sibirica]|uniref:Uncharacterized protein n=1 Tax=Granulicella sibirica TaxID=2479048 RepID=A0A4Q0SYV3_9BACT|nr:hypothetical protein GRAN_3310 [Granulicella sibirica]
MPGGLLPSTLYLSGEMRINGRLHVKGLRLTLLESREAQAC